jgi:hypothetical protein
MAEAIRRQDAQAFAAAYRTTLEALRYGCHKTSGKPYLRPTVPEAPRDDHQRSGGPGRSDARAC